MYDCHARVWYKRNLKEVQKWMDKCYRYVWSDRNGQLLKQKSERGVNMVDVRERLGMKSVAITCVEGGKEGPRENWAKGADGE